jgi:hypothetical protein
MKTDRISASEANRRKAVALAEIRELEAAELRGKLIRVDMVRETWASIATMTRTAVEHLPDRIMARMGAYDLMETQQIYLLMREECRALLIELAEQGRNAVPGSDRNHH